MRGPRYRFPEIVRSTTRGMAETMKREDSIARTPEELDAWVSQRPEILASLEKGGYGRAFNADDLLPLLHVMIGPGHLAPAPEANSAQSSSHLVWGGAILALLLFAALLYILLR